MQGVYNIWMHLTVSRVAGLARAPNPDAAVAAGRGLDGGQVSREDNAQREGEYQSVVSARAPCSGRQSCWTLENMLFARKVANLSKISPLSSQSPSCSPLQSNPRVPAVVMGQSQMCSRHLIIVQQFN